MLLLLLLCTAGVCVYYSINPYDGNLKQRVISARPVKKAVMTDTASEMVVTDSIVPTSPLDSANSIRIHADSAAGQKKVAQLVELANPDTEEKNEEVSTISEEDLVSTLTLKPELISISEDDGLVCFYDKKKKTLFFHPSNIEWSKVYLIYPNPDNKNLIRRNLMYPDYEGLFYPLYKKGEIVHKGERLRAVSVKINSRASKNRSYVIEAKSNPPYFIFGDYEDKTKWYIYENGKVRKFSPPPGFDELLTQKL